MFYGFLAPPPPQPPGLRRHYLNVRFDAPHVISSDRCETSIRLVRQKYRPPTKVVPDLIRQYSLGSDCKVHIIHISLVLRLSYFRVKLFVRSSVASSTLVR